MNWNWILHPIKSFVAWKDKRYIKRMIKEAKRMHLVTGKQYHVVPELLSNKLMVVDRNYIKSYNRLIKGKRVTGIDLMKMAVYSTKLDGLEKKLSKLKI
jgi:hypothetical protein